MANELLSLREKNFIHDYHARLKKLQDAAKDEWVYYTKITISYAVLNSFYEIGIIFHPKAIAKHKTWLKPTITDKQIKDVLEEIIIYETTSANTCLQAEELSKVIQEFRNLQLKC